MPRLGSRVRVPFFAQREHLHTLSVEFSHSAKIAQLVEHNLAKVGVAGSSPVFRSIKKLSTEVLTDSFDVRVVELVDTLL